MNGFLLRICALFTALTVISGFAIVAFLGNASSKDPSILADKPLSVNNPEKKFTVILDPGHGGEDGGAVAEDQTAEKDLNLQLCLRLRDLLSAMGYRVLLTRELDVMQGNGQTGHKKLADLKYRLDFANQYPNALLISVHMNKFPMEYCKGIQLFYSPNHPESQRFASVLHALVKHIQPDNRRELKQAGSAIYLLDRVQIPAILVECGFLSNPQELELLKEEAYQKKLAVLLASALSSYKEKNNEEKDVKSS